ncbi:hypothetical protein D3C87_1701870 [compost metagenome]
MAIEPFYAAGQHVDLLSHFQQGISGNCRHRHGWIADLVGELGDADHTECGDDAKFAHLCTECVGELRALTNEKIARTKQHACRLLLDAFDRHEAHRRASHGLANRLGIGGISLATLHIGLDVDRGDHSGVMSEGGNLARPVMRTCAGFVCRQRP